MIPRQKAICSFMLCFGIFLLAIIMCGYGNSRAAIATTPRIDRGKTILRVGKKQLVIIGENFEPGIFVQMETKKGIMTKGEIKLEDSHTIIIEGIGKRDFPDGVATITLRNQNGSEMKETLAVIPSAIGPSPLTEADIQQIISQGASIAIKLGFAGTFCVMDREGNVLALYRMKGANKIVVVRDVGQLGSGLEGAGGPNPNPLLNRLNQVIPDVAAVMSKAGVGSFFGTQGNAFSTRTAAWIIRENIPPFIRNRVSGPLFGVQISSLGCSDVKQPGLPLGLAGDTGGFPIYKNGIMAGGFGVELNGEYNIALNRPEDLARPVTPDDLLYFREGIEEICAVAALKGFEAPDAITADKILVDGIRLPYTRKLIIPSFNIIPFDSLPGKLLPLPGETTARIRTRVPTEFRDIMLRNRPVRVVNRFFPFKNGTAGLTAADVEQMLFQGVKEANRVRAAIRRPIEVAAEVNVSVEDSEGNVLGLVSTPDAPIFGFDVSVQKGRATALFSRPDSALLLQLTGLSDYVNRMRAEGFTFDGKFIFPARSIGFIHRPFFPDGINDEASQGPGPLSTPISSFSPVNNGFQTDYLTKGMRNNDILTIIIARSIVNAITGTKDPFFCDASNGRAFKILNNTVMIFAGSSPIFKNGQFAGAVGISGDGIDQDDIISAYGSENFEAPPERRSDRFFMRGIRLPYTKFPRHPHLGEE
ncbi:MAG: hypothetical protein AB1489_20715 [Acidobacteriota bacterium]